MRPEDKTPSQENGQVQYCAEYAQQAERLSQLGLDDADLAFFFGVNQGTLDQWKAEQLEFLTGIEIGRLTVEGIVERATVRNITGYTAIKQRVLRGRVIELEYHVRGDPWAGMEWLSLRKPSWVDGA
ncbi:hypothetical protein [Methyloceanibacter superfactus]|nr:hypothetical protein [Methyloceanibacter superfactus]